MAEPEIADLDQCLTTAMAAMAFAAANWVQFCAFMLPTIGRVPPVNPMEIRLQAMRLGALTDPERMPRG